VAIIDRNFCTTSPFIRQVGREPLPRSAVFLNPRTQFSSFFRCHTCSVAKRHGLACDRLGENPDAMGAELFEIL
jgi:hypothetical protein